MHTHNGYFSVITLVTDRPIRNNTSEDVQDRDCYPRMYTNPGPTGITVFSGICGMFLEICHAWGHKANLKFYKN